MLKAATRNRLQLLLGIGTKQALNLQFQIIRNVFIYSKSRHQRRAPKKYDINLGRSEKNKISVDLVKDDDSDEVVAQKLKNLQKLTHSLQKKVKNSKADPIHEALNKNADGNILSEEKDVDQIYKHLLAGDQAQKDIKALPSSGGNIVKSKMTYFDSLSRGPQINEIIASRLGDSVRLVSSKFNQNWEKLLDEVYDKNPMIFKDVPIREVENFIALIPPQSRARSLALISELLSEASIVPTRFIYDLFLASLASRESVDNMIEVDSFYEQLIAEGLKPSVHTYGNYFKAVSKSSKYFIKYKSNTFSHKQVKTFKDTQLSKINKRLSEMKEFNLKPNLVVYTNIMQACMILDDFKQAVEIFDMCKFHNFKIDDKMYNSMILVQIKQDNLERSLDLYQEMLETSVKPSSETFFLLAEACALNTKYLLKAWEFLLEYIQNHSDTMLTKKVVEIMMLLAAKDADLMLSRILFLQSFKKFLSKDEQPGPEFVNLLFECYKNFNPEEARTKIPVMMSNEKTKNLRYNLINSIDFRNLYLQNLANEKDENMITESSDFQLPPLLPLYQITTSKQIIEESRAVWTHVLFNFPQYVNIHNVSSYLKVIMNHALSIDEFKQKFHELTYFDNEGLIFHQVAKDGAKTITIEEDYFEDSPEDLPVNDSSSQALPEVVSIASDRQKILKLARTNALYKLCLVASKKFKNFEFMQETWIERGKFRKTSRFSNLAIHEKNKLDFEFAREMVQALLSVGLIQDALNIVLSTENQFKWTFYYLKNIYVFAESIGDEVVKQRVKQVAAKYKPVDHMQYKQYSAKRYG